jgi:D-sedoheptulose 7-phosphate isomerase
MSLANYFAESIRVLERARQSWTDDLVARAVDTITDALRSGKPVLVCGNGGSAADAMHITTELVGRFLVDRKALNVICLASNTAVLSALANDPSYDSVFARQVEAYGQPGAILIGISTSGTSANVVSAFVRARSLGMKTVALTGEGGGQLSPLSDYLFAVPSRSTPLVQQAHICLYHYFCQSIEQAFAPEQSARPLAAVTEP